MTPNELKHFGVLGMKWGVRKGSKTGASAGSKAKTGASTASKSKTGAESQNGRSSDYAKASALKNKRIANMSNDELAEVTRRIQLEQNYRRVTTPTKSKGRAFVEAQLQNVGKMALDEFNTKFVKPRIEKAMQKAMDKLAQRARTAAARTVRP